MDLLETTTHSFVIKIWLEETIEEAEEAVWRGRITHVPSGENRYVKELDEIVQCVALRISDYLPNESGSGQFIVKGSTRIGYERLQSIKEVVPTLDVAASHVVGESQMVGLHILHR